MFLRLKSGPVSFWVFNGLVLVLVVLVAKDPFSGLNAISELEPSPDAIHYLSPVKSLFDGHGLTISYQGRSIPTAVPPLYSLTLVPFYGLFQDPRMFYLLNVSLAILSVCLFFKLCQKLLPTPVALWLTLGSFCTNFILFWYPSYPMAENLLILLSVGSFFLLIPPATWRKALAVGCLVVLMFATKYVAWVEGVALIVAFLAMVWTSSEKKSTKFKLSGLSLGALAGGLFLLVFLETLTQGAGILAKIRLNLEIVWQLIWKHSANKLDQPANHFNNVPFWDNLLRYLAGLMGGLVTMAGKRFSLVTPIIGFGAILAVLLLAWNNLTRYIFAYILISILGSLWYLSAFETVDARYFFAFIPAMLLLFGFSLEAVANLLNKFHFYVAKKLFLGVVVFLVFWFAIPPVLQALSTNFNHSDQSVNFQTISVMNHYFSTHNFPIKPTVLTVLSPYQVDFFSNHTYELLPLSKKQYFTVTEAETWGIMSSSSYLSVYQQRLDKGILLFVSNYHTSSKFVFWTDFQALGQNFQITKVAGGCNGQCDLYQIDSAAAKPTY